MNITEHKKALLLTKLETLVKDCQHLQNKVDCAFILEKMLSDTSNKYTILWNYLKEVSPTSGLSYSETDKQLNIASIFCAYMNVFL